MKESFESTNNREDDKLRIPQLETQFAVQRKRDRFPLDRKVEILKFNQDILLAQLSTISTMLRCITIWPMLRRPRGAISSQ